MCEFVLPGNCLLQDPGYILIATNIREIPPDLRGDLIYPDCPCLHSVWYAGENFYCKVAEAGSPPAAWEKRVNLPFRRG